MRLHRTLAADAKVGAQGHIDAAAAMLPVPFDEREIALLEPSLAQQRVQRAQRACLARNEETAARVPVEAMDEFKGVLGPQRAQHLDDSEAHSAAAVDRDSGGLVDDE